MVANVGLHRIIAIESIGVYPNVSYREVVDEVCPPRQLTPEQQAEINKVPEPRNYKDTPDTYECRHCRTIFPREQVSYCGDGKESCPSCYNPWHRSQD